MSKYNYNIGDKIWTHIWEEIHGTNVAEGTIVSIRRTLIGKRYFIRYTNLNETITRPRFWWRIWQ